MARGRRAFRRGRRQTRRRRGRRRNTLGGMIRGKMHPPTNSASPWNSYCMTSVWTSVKTGSICVTLKQLRDWMKIELGIAANSRISMRLLRVDVWTEPPDANTRRNCVIFSPSDWVAAAGDCKTTRQLNWFEAWGTAVQPAHVHYVWPKSISNYVLRDETTTSSLAPVPDTSLVLFRFDIKSIDGGFNYIIKSHLLWRLQTPDPYPSPSMLGEHTTMRTHLVRPPEYYIVNNLLRL